MARSKGSRSANGNGGMSVPGGDDPSEGEDDCSCNSSCDCGSGTSIQGASTGVQGSMPASVHKNPDSSRFFVLQMDTGSAIIAHQVSEDLPLEIQDLLTGQRSIFTVTEADLIAESIQLARALRRSPGAIADQFNEQIGTPVEPRSNLEEGRSEGDADNSILDEIESILATLLTSTASLNQLIAKLSADGLKELYDKVKGLIDMETLVRNGILTEEEARQLIVYILLLKAAAEKFAKEHGGDDAVLQEDLKEAFMHICVSALLCWLYGREKAEKIMTEHETSSPANPAGSEGTADTEIDKANNGIGCGIGIGVREKRPPGGAEVPRQAGWVCILIWTRLQIYKGDFFVRPGDKAFSETGGRYEKLPPDTPIPKRKDTTGKEEPEPQVPPGDMSEEELKELMETLEEIIEEFKKTGKLPFGD